MSSKSLSATKLVSGALGIVGGIWLVLAPSVLSYSAITVMDAKTKKPVSAELGAVGTSDLICGILLIALVGFCLLTASNAAMSKLRLYAGIATVAVGVYLMAAPYLMDLFGWAEYLNLNKPNTNDVLMGILTVIVAGFAVQNEFFLAEKAPKTTSQVAPTA